MATKNSLDALNTYLRATSNSDFLIGTDKFEDLSINEVADGKGFHYFGHTRKPLITRFILKRTKLSEKICYVTLIKNKANKFEARLVFEINNLSSKSVEQFTLPVESGENRLVKARVDLSDCHDALSELFGFLESCSGVAFSSDAYAVVTAQDKKRLENAIGASSKNDVLIAIAEKFAHEITDADVAIITKRRSALKRFRALLDDKDYFLKYQEFLKSEGKGHRREDVWQHFFENNTWIFGYGLRLVACEGLDDHKLETTVVGTDVFDGPGKRIDALLKTKGQLNSALLTEIKLHDTSLLEKYDRPGVWSPAKELRGAVAQVQKTLHKATLKASKNFQAIVDGEGAPTGESVAFVKPRGVVVIGTLGHFQTEHGVNEEQFASFEIYRQQISGLEIITFDELYERARYIVEES